MKLHPIRLVLTILFLQSAIHNPPSAFGHPQSTDLRITDVKISTPSFTPSGGERLNIKFALSADATVTLKIFDPDFERVRALLDRKPLRAGNHTVSWDGKDSDGAVVPNEAYFFTIEAHGAGGLEAVYDPITFSGGEVCDVTKADFDNEQNTITYTLERTGRVLIRMGIHNGPLLRTLVDWKPRLAGLVTEYWNGRDESGMMSLREQANFSVLVTSFTLPENATVTYGNNAMSYPGYKERTKGKREKKPVRERNVQTARRLSPHFLLPRMEDRAPKVSLSFPGVQERNSDQVPVVRGLTLVRVDLEDSFKKRISNQQYEIMFFMDRVFFAEEEAGHIPYNFQWDFPGCGQGEHILTVNIATMNDQIGAASARVFVKEGLTHDKYR